MFMKFRLRERREREEIAFSPFYWAQTLLPPTRQLSRSVCARGNSIFAFETRLVAWSSSTATTKRRIGYLAAPAILKKPSALPARASQTARGSSPRSHPSRSPRQGWANRVFLEPVSQMRIVIVGARPSSRGRKSLC